MSKIELVRQSVERHLSDINDLLAMRLVFPPQNIVVPIEKEILDLYIYPERLDTSYRDEWQAIARRALYKHGFSGDERSDEASLDAFVNALRDQTIPRCIEDHPGLFQSLAEIQLIQCSNNTVPFPHPKRQSLKRLIWPDK